MRNKQFTWSCLQSFVEGNIQNNVPSRAGIYLLLSKQDNGKWNYFYIGKSDNLKTCLMNHLVSDKETVRGLKEKIRDGICAYEYIVIGRKNERNGIEKFLYNYYNLECNTDFLLNVEPIKIKLP